MSPTRWTTHALGFWGLVGTLVTLGCSSSEGSDRPFANGPEGGVDGSSGASGAGGGGFELPPDFGNPCNSGSDCSSGVCVEGPDGSVCSAPCDGSCPDDHECLPLEGLSPPDDHACVPQLARLCRPCNGDAECQREGVVQDGSRCIPRGDFGSYCGIPCAADACPDSYACDEVKLPSGVSVFQCVPEGGRSCDCRDSWAGQGLQTTCSASNSYGSCSGTRSCDADGLTTCTAATPSAEVCDGADNDCDGSVDDGTCSDGLDCTADLCDGTGACSNPVAASSCLIGGECVNSGDVNPTNSCQSCDPSSSQTEWTVNTGACDDGDACTTGDTCADGLCVGEIQQDTYEPNDGQSTAASLLAASDCDDFPKGSVSATLYGAGDEDWFRYHLSDDYFCFIYPRATLTVPAGANHDLCVYFVCENGSKPSVECTAGQASEAFGMSGCCSNNDGPAAENVKLNHTCASGSDDSGTAFVRVFNAGPSYSCAPYTLQYGDD